MKKNSIKLKGSWKKNLFIFSFMIYPVLNFIVFFIYINFNSVIISFQTFNYNLGSDVWCGFRNYIDIIKSSFGALAHPKFTYGIKNSIYLCLWNNFIILPLSLFSAYLFYKKIPGEKVFRIIFFLPAIISVVVLCMLYSFMFSTNYGPINILLKNIGLGGIIPANGWFGDAGTLFLMVLIYGLWTGIGYNVLLVSGAMARIPYEVIEAGQLDGIGLLKEFWYIVLPLVMPTISTMFVTGLTLTFNYFLPSQLLTNGGPTGEGYTIAYNIIDYTLSGKTNMAAAYGWIAALIGIPFVLIGKFLIEKFVPDTTF